MYKDRVQYVCEPQSEILAQVFGVLLCKDDPKIHPSLLCHSCYCTVMKAKAAIEDGGQYTPSVTVFTWEAHSTDHCRTCDHFESAYSGGRRKKRKRPGRPASISARTAISHIRSIAPSSFNTPDVSMDDSHSTNLLCRLCSKLLDRPVLLTSCNSLVCMNCLCEHLEKSKSFICPCCSSDHIQDFTTIVEPSSVVTSVLGSVKVTCSVCKNSIASGKFRLYTVHFLNITLTLTNKINTYVHVVDFQRHSESQCREGLQGLQPPGPSSSVHAILAKSPEAPLTPLEQKLTTSLVRRQLSDGNETLKVKTRGQVMNHNNQYRAYFTYQVYLLAFGVHEGHQTKG